MPAYDTKPPSSDPGVSKPAGFGWGDLATILGGIFSGGGYAGYPGTGVPGAPKPNVVPQGPVPEVGHAAKAAGGGSWEGFWHSMFVAFATEGRDWGFYGAAILLVVIGLWAVLK